MVPGSVEAVVLADMPVKSAGGGPAIEAVDAYLLGSKVGMLAVRADGDAENDTFPVPLFLTLRLPDAG